MQGLVNYAASPSPSPSPPRGQPGVGGPSRIGAPVRSSGAVRARKVEHDIPSRSAEAGPSGSKSHHKTLKNPVLSSSSASPAPRPTKKRRKSPSNLPENLTHTSQATLPASELAKDAVAVAEETGEVEGWPGYPGLTDEEVFRLVTIPDADELAGMEDWGVPGEVSPDEADPALQAKVKKFLQLKDEQGEHINTRLLSSSAFSNPRVNSQLIDFVSISEHLSAFPSGGWLTRRNIEAEIPTYGPAALNAQQKALADAAKQTREAEGSSRRIGFVGAKKQDEGRSNGRESKWSDEGHHGSRGGSGGGSRDERSRYNDRERDRYRNDRRDRDERRR